jgi:hypothetical protein
VRSTLAVALTLAGGVAIGWVDSRPTWDDTGVTAFALLLVAAVGAALARRAAVPVALGVGLPTPLLELHDHAALAALAFAAVGAAIGAAVAAPAKEPADAD